MKVVLKPGEKVEVEFAESDGSITVEFTKVAIRVRTDWPDTKGRQGVIYEEKFATHSELEKLGDLYYPISLDGH